MGRHLTQGPLKSLSLPTTFQAEDEGSIPFTRSNLFNDLGGRRAPCGGIVDHLPLAHCLGITDEEREVNENDADIKTEIAAGITRKMRVVLPTDGMGSNWLFEGQHGPRVIDLNDHKDVPGVVADHVGMASEALTILLASLACKNVVKDVRYNGQIGRGAHAVPVYENGLTFISMTCVRPPTLMGGHTGIVIKPHMRRGHEHTVVHGKGRTLRRVQWFAPCYVGYDPAFAPPAPHEYRVTP